MTSVPVGVDLVSLEHLVGTNITTDWGEEGTDSGATDLRGGQEGLTQWPSNTW